MLLFPANRRFAAVLLFFNEVCSRFVPVFLVTQKREQKTGTELLLYLKGFLCLFPLFPLFPFLKSIFEGSMYLFLY